MGPMMGQAVSWSEAMGEGTIRNDFLEFVRGGWWPFLSLTYDRDGLLWKLGVADWTRTFMKIRWEVERIGVLFIYAMYNERNTMDVVWILLALWYCSSWIVNSS